MSGAQATPGDVDGHQADTGLDQPDDGGEDEFGVGHVVLVFGLRT